MTKEHDNHAGAGHITVGKYLLGFMLAIGLTVLSFGIVAMGIQPKYAAVIGLVLAAIVQILTHLYFFLHLDRSPENMWNLIAIVFTGIVLFLFIGGTVWVIFSLNSRLM